MTEPLPASTDLLQQLPRFLFLEETLEGRRVLEVGATSFALAEVLIALGAKRVVCAVDDDHVETLREAGAPRGVDVRRVRDGVLPGDDGAFDLVIDFTLPQALAGPDAERDAEIARLLSEDGFALTAVAGDPATAQSPVLPVPDAGRGLGYRDLAERLHDMFDVVEVYFQSLLVGYLFGSFDADPGDDGVAPHTGLMGDEAEPASYYLFAFGNAVPVIDDVSLVQVPVGSLPAPVRVAAPAAAPVPSTSPAELDALREALSERDEVIASLAERVPVLRDNIQRLFSALAEEQRTEEVLRIQLDELVRAGAAKDAQVAALADQVAELSVHQHEQGAHDDERLMQLERALHQSDQRVAELEHALGRAQQKLDQAEQGQHEAERVATALQEALRGKDESERSLNAELSRLQAEGLSPEETEAIQEEFSALRQASAQQIESLRMRLEDVVKSSAQKIEGLQFEINGLQVALSDARDEGAFLYKKQQALKESARTLEAERDKMESERNRLADGVNRLMRDRAQERDRVAALEQQLAQVRASAADAPGPDELAAREQALAEVRQQLEVETQKSVRAQEALAEVAAQRDAMQKTVLARDREIVELAEDLETARHAHEARDDEIEALRKDIAQRDEQLAELGQHLTYEQQTRGKLEQAVREANHARDQAVQSAMSTKAALEQVELERDAARRELAEMAAQLDDLSRAAADREQLTAQVKDRDERLSTLAAKVTSLTEAVEQSERALVAQGAAADEQVSSLTARLEIAETERSAALEAGGKAAEQVRTLQERLDVVTRKAAALADDLENTSVERTSLSAQLEAVREDLTQSQQAQHDVDEAVRRVRHERDALQAEVNERRRRADELLADIRRLSGQVEQAESARRALAIDLEQARKTLRILREDGGAAEEARDALMRQVDELSVALREARASAEASGSAWERAQAEVVAAEQTRDDALRRASSAETHKAAAEEEARFSAQKLSDATQSFEEERARLLAEGTQLAATLGQAKARAVSAEESAAALRRELSAAEEKERALSEALAEAEGALSAQRHELLARLETGRVEATQREVERDLLAAQLEEAQGQLIAERARGELFGQLLEDARTAAADAQALGELHAAQLEEAQLLLYTERARGALYAAQLEEAQERLESEHTERNLFSAELDEAQRAGADKDANLVMLKGRLVKKAEEDAEAQQDLSSRIDEERARTEGWERRALEAEVVLERERAEHETQTDRLRTELEQAESARRDAERDRADLELQVSDSAARVKALESACQALNVKVAEANKRVEQEGAQAVREELRAAEQALLAKEGEVAALKQALDRLRDELVDAKNVLAKSTTTVEGGAVMSAEDLRAQIEDLERQKAALLKDNTEKNERINRLTQRLVANEGL